MATHDILASFFTLAGDTRLAVLGGTEVSPHDLRRRIEVAAATGYTGFAFAEKDLRHWSDRYPLTEIRRILDGNGIRVVELENLSGWHLDGDARADSDSLQTELLEWAGELGARHVKVCAAVITESGAGNAGLLLDAWHVARSGTDFHSLRALPGERIASVELMDAAKDPVDGDPIKDGSDYRRVAGTGELGVDAFVEAVLSTGYSGPFGDENLSIENRERSLEDAASASYNAVTKSLSQRKRLARREVR